MNQVITNTLAPGQTVKVDPHKGTMLNNVSSQWWSRPDDQRFLNLADLEAKVLGRRQGATEGILDSTKLAFQAKPDDPNNLEVVYDGTPKKPNHWSFGQLCSLVKAPAGYLRGLPSTLAGINLQYGFTNMRSSFVKMYNSPTEIYAATGPEYGRVFDHELVAAVRQVAGNGTGDTRWKIPGVIDWSTRRYNPFVEPTKDSTTLYASDRDVFMFLVDDTHPIQIGKLDNGDPDIVFRGFFCWNSEMGSKTLGISTFLFRAVCQNRCIWGAQDVQQVTIRHSKSAPDRFIQEVGPALVTYADASDRVVINGIKAARDKVVADSDDARRTFLLDRKFTESQTSRIIAAVTNEEGHPATSIWDFVNGISAVARTVGYTDERVDMERRAGKLLAQAGR